MGGNCHRGEPLLTTPNVLLGTRATWPQHPTCCWAGIWKIKCAKTAAFSMFYFGEMLWRKNETCQSHAGCFCHVLRWMEVGPSGFGEDAAPRKSPGEGRDGAAGLADLGTCGRGDHQARGLRGVLKQRVPSPESHTQCCSTLQ